VRKRFDLRRVPISALFLIAALGIWYYLLRFDIPEIAKNPSAFAVRAAILFPVALFFASMATIVLWYVFRIFLPGAIRYRRLQLLRYRRALRSRTQHEDPHQSL
jgi:hypothetical protein